MNTFSNKKWLGKIDSSQSITDIAIPGTHDTMTQTCQDIYYKTQTLSLIEQLEIGVRFLDIRLTRELFAAHREWISTISAQEIIDIVTTFLEKNPTEFVIMRIQNANEKKDDFNEYKHAIHSVIKENLNHFLLPQKIANEHNEFSWPTIAEARGKIIAIECSPEEFEVPYIDETRWAHSWHKNNLIRLQDEWDGPQIDDKLLQIENLLNYPNQGAGAEGRKLYLNHISATNGTLGNPLAYAEIINPQSHNLLRQTQENKRVKEAEGKSIVTTGKGVVIFDFVDEKLSAEVIAINNR